MTAATDTDIQQIKDLITAGTAATQKQVADLTQEMRVGFAEVKGEIREVKAELKGELKALDTKFEEKTKNLDQRISGREFINRGITVGLVGTVMGGLLLALGKILFFGKIL